MRKIIVTGLLALVIIAAGGTGIYFASANENPGMNSNQMNEMMKLGKFEDMQKLMNEMGTNMDHMQPFMLDMHNELQN